MGSKIIFTIKMPQEKLKFFEKVKYFMLKRKIERLKEEGKHTLAMTKLEKEGIILHYSIDEKADEKIDEKINKKTDKETDKKVVSWISW